MPGQTQGPPPEKTFDELLEEAKRERAASVKLQHIQEQLAKENHQQAMKELYERTKAKSNLKGKGSGAQKPPLKLFKVSIPSQTIPTNFTLGKQFTVGEITDYGFIQGREIIVLGTGLNRIHDQCLEELGCKPHELDMTVEEISGPFAHGTVIAAFFVPGL